MSSLSGLVWSGCKIRGLKGSQDEVEMRLLAHVHVAQMIEKEGRWENESG